MKELRCFPKRDLTYRANPKSGVLVDQVLASKSPSSIKFGPREKALFDFGGRRRSFKEAHPALTTNTSSSTVSPYPNPCRDKSCKKLFPFWYFDLPLSWF